MELKEKYERRRRLARWLAIPVAGLVGLLAAACAGDNDQRAGAAPVEPAERTLYVQATELDARRTLEQNEFPQATRDAFPQYFGAADDATDRGNGYYLFMTSEDEWRIGSYMFLPSQAMVWQGDRVTLEIFGVRGGHHGNILLDPDGMAVTDADGNDIHFDVKRGELHQVQFTAVEAGTYQLICLDHGPTMVMNIHVLPR